MPDALVSAIRADTQGAYDDLPDDVLRAKWLTKYPGASANALRRTEAQPTMTPDAEPDPMQSVLHPRDWIQHKPSAVDPERVTLEDVQRDPVDAMKRVGTLIGRDLADPKLWIAAAATYFGAKALSAIGPVLVKAAKAAPRVGRAVAQSAEVADIPLVGPTIDRAVKLSQRTRAVLATPNAAAPTSAPAPASAPPETAIGSSAPVRPAASPPTAAAGLTADEAEAVRRLVAQGYPEDQVLQQLGKARPAPGKTFLNAAESKEYIRLRKAGQTHQQALELVEAQRALQQRLGLPSSETTRRAVADRNATGRWRE